MSHYLVDERDVKFVLNEQIGLDKLLTFPQFSELSDDMIEMVINEALKFAKNEISPINTTGDKEGAKFDNGKVTVPAGYKEAYTKFVENGWLGLTANPEFGGQGFPMTIGAAATEFFCGASLAVSVYADLTQGAAHIFEVFANDDLKARYVERMYTGEWAGTMCLTEPGAGSDVGALTTTAVREGDHYKVTGTKSFISGGDHNLTENIIHPVLARVEGSPKGVKGISLILVPKIRVNDDGSLGERNDVVCSGIEEKMGIHASCTCTLNFGDNGNCIGWIVGEENEGIKYMFQMMNEARLFVGVQGFATGATAYMNALAYARDRVQMAHVSEHKNPDAPAVAIIEHPDVRRNLLKMKAYTEGMRALLYTTAYFNDLAHYSEDEEERTKNKMLVDLLIPICKAYSTDSAFMVTETAMQVYGGYGYCGEYPAEQYCRDTKITAIYEGTNGIQALDLLGRKLAMKGGMLFMNYLTHVNAFVEAKGDHPKVGDLVKKFADAKDVLAQTAMNFGQMAQGGEFLLTVLNATPFLEMFSEVVISQLLAEQACIASDKLDAIFAEKGADDEAAQKALIADNDEARFYYGKIQSAKWYINNVLPNVKAKAEAFENKDSSALDIVF